MQATGADNRRAERIESCAMRVVLDGEEVPVVDISGSGVLIDGGPDWVIPGQGLRFSFVINIHNQDKYIPAYGTVIRNENRGIAVNYESPHPSWAKVLTDYLKSQT